MGRYRLIRIVFILLTILILFIHCAGPFRSAPPMLPMNPDTLIENIQDHASRLQTFEGRATFSVVSTEGAYRGSMKLSVKMPDSLWMKLEGPLGVDYLTGRFTGEQALLYSPWEKAVYEGSYQQMRELALIPLDMGFADMALGLLGLLIPNWIGNDSSSTVRIDSRRYLLDLGYGERIWIEPQGPVVTRWEKKDENDEILWVWEAKEFRKNKGIRFPKVIRMTSYLPKQRITLVYERIKANKPMRNGWSHVKIPEGVETIEL